MSSYNSTTASSIEYLGLRAYLNLLDCSKNMVGSFNNNPTFASGSHFTSLISGLENGFYQTSSNVNDAFRGSALEQAFLDNFANFLSYDHESKNITASMFV